MLTLPSPYLIIAWAVVALVAFGLLVLLANILGYFRERLAERSRRRIEAIVIDSFEVKRHIERVSRDEARFYAMSADFDERVRRVKPKQ